MKYLDKLNFELIRQHVEQTNFLWGDTETVPERYARMITDVKEQDGKFFFSGLVDDKSALKASLKRYYFDLVIGGKINRCLGLGAIFTEPRSRGRGLAEALIKKVLEESKNNFDCSVALLFSDIEPIFYHKFGFKELSAKKGMSVVAPQGGNYVNFREPRADELSLLMNFFSAFTKDKDLYARRTVVTWPFYRSINRIGKDYLIIRSGELVGFVTMTKNGREKVLIINELIVGQKDLSDTWNSLMHFARELGLKELRGWENPLLKIPFDKLEKRANAIPMMASLNAEHLNIKSYYFSTVDHF